MLLVPMTEEQIIKLLQELELMRLILVAIVCLALLEYIALLPREIHYMWGRGAWTSVRVLFFLVRYTVFIDLPLNIPLNRASGLGSAGCTPLLWMISGESPRVTAVATRTHPLRMDSLQRGGHRHL